MVCWNTKTCILAATLCHIVAIGQSMMNFFPERLEKQQLYYWLADVPFVIYGNGVWHGASNCHGVKDPCSLEHPRGRRGPISDREVVVPSCDMPFVLRYYSVLPQGNTKWDPFDHRICIMLPWKRPWEQPSIGEIRASAIGGSYLHLLGTTSEAGAHGGSSVFGAILERTVCCWTTCGIIPIGSRLMTGMDTSSYMIIHWKRMKKRSIIQIR